MPKSATSSETISNRPDRDANYSLESTIQAAIDRTAEAYADTNPGQDIEAQPHMERWYAYAAEMQDMADNWADFYPLACQLAEIRPTTLASLWHDLIG